MQYVEHIGTLIVALRKENDVPVRAVSVSFALSGATTKWDWDTKLQKFN